MIRTVKDYEKISEQYNKMLAERNSLIDDLSWYKAKVSRLEENNDKLNEIFDYQENKKKEYREAIEKLEHENKKLKEENKDVTIAKDRFVKGCYLRNKEILQLKESRDWDYEYIVKVNEENKRLEDENEQLKKENEMIDEQFTDYIDETCGYLKLLFEISQHIGNKPSSSTYKYFRAKLDGIGIKEGE